MKVLDDRHLEDIPDPRLFNLKVKTLRYKFNVVHVPGVKNKPPDATSRHPTGKEDHMEIASMGVEEDRLSKVFMAGLRTQPDQADTVTSLETEQCIMGKAKASLASPSLAMNSATSMAMKPATGLAMSPVRGVSPTTVTLDRRTPGSTPGSGLSCPPLTQSCCMSRG